MNSQKNNLQFLGSKVAILGLTMTLFFLSICFVLIPSTSRAAISSEYIMTGNVTTVDTYGNSVNPQVDCSQSTPSGYALTSRVCITSNGGICRADQCLWKKLVSNNNYEYTTTSTLVPAGSLQCAISRTYSYGTICTEGNTQVNCSSTNSPSGYSFKDRICLRAGANNVCFADICFWEKPSNIMVNYNLTHSGSDGTAVDCSGQAPNGYSVTKRECIMQGNNCYSDTCLNQTQPIAPVCTQNSDCGTNGIVGSPLCQNGNVYQNFQTFTCNNPGTAGATCSNSTQVQLQQTCLGNQTCSSGTCVNSCQPTTNTLILNPTGSLCNSTNTVNGVCTRTVVPFSQQSSGPVTFNYAGAQGGWCGWYKVRPIIDGIQYPDSPILGASGSGYPSSTQFTANLSAGMHTMSLGGVATYLGPCGPTEWVPPGSGWGGSLTVTDNICQNNTCTPNASQKCVGNSVYNFDSCGNQGGLVQMCSGNQTCSSGTCVNQNIQCSTNSQCGTSTVTGSPFCSGNSVYQNYTTYTCNNPGTPQSYCSNSTQQQLSQMCAYNQTCSQNACITNQTQNQTFLQVTKTSRNLSVGNLTWSNTTNASPKDILQFQITVQNTGTQTVNNVILQDILPSKLVYNNNLTLDGMPNSGTITSLNIGSVNPGQTRTITYQAQVALPRNFAFGANTVVNTATVSSSDLGVAQGTGSASVIVTRQQVLGATSVSTGLTNNPLADSFAIPLLIGLIGVWMYRSGIIALPGWVRTRMEDKKETMASKNLQSKIDEIKQKEVLS